ncbi:MAG TPA: hypothetical protein VIM99_14700 [Blastocatellia bacterium]
MPKPTTEAIPLQRNSTTGARHWNRKPKKPVKWLLGSQLLRSLKGVLLYTAFGKELDPRQWMQPEVFPKPASPGQLEFWREQRLLREKPEAIEEEKNKNQSDSDYWLEKGGFWFDYISDTGDGMLATYSIAYLCLSDLYAPKSPSEGDEVKTCSNKGEIEGDVSLLPRGEFLLVGGDTAYHVADYETLALRFRIPFAWAYGDVAEERRKSGDRVDAEEEPNRPIFGIPGNHDYYNQLNGFRRQFRAPVKEELRRGFYPRTTKPEELAARPRLYLPGFNRYQQASYLALRLPFGWWLWGLDTEVGQVDERQEKFFRDLCDAHPHDGSKIIPPKKLIVATCAPTTVFGKLASPEDKKTAGAFEQLGLARPFLPEQRGAQTRDFESLLRTTGDAQLEAGQCRLDISGDVHHYARYWGPKPSRSVDDGPVRSGAKAPAPTAESYASVVSGLGGAFLHPSNTYVDQAQEQVLYPSEKKSAEIVAQRIFNPYRIFDGGLIFLAGFIIAFSICFATTMTPSGNEFINDPFSFKALFGEGWGILTGALLLSVSPVPLIAAIVRKKLFERASGEIHPKPGGKLWATFAASSLALVAGFLLLGHYGSGIRPFGDSVIIQLSIIWAGSAIVLSMRYREFLYDKAHWGYIQWHELSLKWTLRVSGCMAVASGLWFFGKNLTPAYLVSDLIFMWVIGGSLLALSFLPVYAGADLCQPRMAIQDSAQSGTLSLWRKASRVLFGLWNAILQLGTPFLFTNQMATMTRTEVIALILITAALILAMRQAGHALLKASRRKTLAAAWAAYGALTLALPWLVNKLEEQPGAPFTIELRSGWGGLFWPLAAGLIGLVMSCVWFGWYLGVCFAFNGHNNEVGGACRIEEFKQFIRFRLTEDGLTGYVIAVDHPRMPGRDLKPRLVDIFHLRVKPENGGASAAKPG